MSRFSKFTVAAVLGGAGLLLTPAAAPAQFYGGFGRPFMGGPGAFGGAGFSPSFGLQPIPALPSLPPLSSFPFGGSGYNYASAPFLGYGYGGSMLRIPGVGGSIAVNPFASNFGGYVGSYAVAYYGLQGLYGGSGSSGGTYSALSPSQQHFYRAQQAAGSYASGGRASVADAGAYETSTPPVAGRNAPPPEALQKALSATTEAEVASGEATNVVLAAVQAAEAKQRPRGVPAAYLAPNLLENVRFGGSPAADALNLLRSANRMQLPIAFDSEPLRGTGEALKRDFAAVAAGPLAGKPVDQSKVAKLAQTVKDAKAKVPAGTRDLPFPEAADARAFVGQMEAAAKVLREAGSATLMNPDWATKGTNVADLSRHMAKHKLQFGRADRGGEEAYLALHRAFAGYLFALNQAQAAKK